ncbi:MAG: hypothetical protein KGI50_07480 [Patescibacteria group bacterium]|nr:hypothetical protein [Patescibacteria group bacterium]MDE1971387.1 hypothetical protein [Patescibacteria group bacterium]
MKTITLIASHTVDHIDDRDRGLQIERSGGPAYYCGTTISSLGYRPAIITKRKPVDVFITISDHKEHIRIDHIPTISLPKRLPSHDIILSPILGEFDLYEFRSRRCTVFLDAQGYIRSPRGRNELDWQCDLQDLDQVVALKVNRREFQHVHKSIIDLFKNRILLLTKGSDGVELWHDGRRINIRGHAISSTDTLGAGDTFFGSFVVKFLETKDAVCAARFAVSAAEKLLKKKGGGQ